MKGSYGLIVAVVVGVLGAVLNWIYLENKTRDVENVSFLGLREDVTVQPGERFKDSDLEQVRIPKRNAGNLHEFVHLFSEKATVEGFSPTRAYQGGQLILRADLRTPPKEIAFTSSDQRLVPIRVDPNTFESSLYNPGDQIDFIFPVVGRPVVADGAIGRPDNDEFEIVGPFTIAHIGSRLGSSGAARADRTRPGQERIVGVFATREGDKLDAQTRRLLSLDRRANGQEVRVLMHSPLESKSGGR